FSGLPVDPMPDSELVAGTTSLQVMYMPPPTLPTAPPSNRAALVFIFAPTLACAYMNIDDEVEPLKELVASEPFSPTFEASVMLLSPVKPAKNSLFAKQEPSFE